MAIVLKPGRERKLQNDYPWVYREEIETGNGEAGELVQVQSASGQFIGCGFYNSASHIPVRLLTRDPEEKLNRAFWRTRLQAAAARRAGRVQNTEAYRLVHAEADRLPGLIVDRLGPLFVVQFRNAGMDHYREEIVRALRQEFSPGGIYERSDVEARAEEGLESRVGPLWGEIPDPIVIHEDDVEFEVSVTRGQKTGFFLDQRENRRLVRSLVAPGARLLDVYAYTGGFGLHAARQGAQVLAIDKDHQALQSLEANAKRNGVSAQVGVRWGDALQVMAQLEREGRAFTHIVLDPPTLVRHKEDVPRIKRLFVEMVSFALALLEPNGHLFLSTCAYHLSANDLLEVARLAANDRQRRAEVLTLTYQPPDHPWILQIPETLYLKSILLRVE